MGVAVKAAVEYHFITDISRWIRRRSIHTAVQLSQSSVAAFYRPYLLFLPETHCGWPFIPFLQKTVLPRSSKLLRQYLSTGCLALCLPIMFWLTDISVAQVSYLRSFLRSLLPSVLKKSLLKLVPKGSSTDLYENCTGTFVLQSVPTQIAVFLTGKEKRVSKSHKCKSW